MRMGSRSWRKEASAAHTAIRAGAGAPRARRAIAAPSDGWKPLFAAWFSPQRRCRYAPVVTELEE